MPSARVAKKSQSELVPGNVIRWSRNFKLQTYLANGTSRKKRNV